MWRYGVTVRKRWRYGVTVRKRWRYGVTVRRDVEIWGNCEEGF